MISLLAKIEPAQIVLIVFIALLVIAYPILISRRNKKENTKLTEQTNSLKRGDKVLTTSGVYGTIVDLQLENDKKIVTIETGTDKKKGYISVDAYAIYTVFKDEEPAEIKSVETLTTEPAKPEENKKEGKADDKKSEVKADDKKADAAVEENKAVEAPADTTVSDVEAQISGKKKKNKPNA